MVAPHAAPPYQQPPGNGMAVAGMVLGIIGLVLCWVPFLGWVCAIVGVILAVLGMGKAKKIGGKGKGMAVAGLVCGIIGLAIGILLFALTMMAASAFDGYMEKAKRSEASLQTRTIEMRAKSFRLEKARFPKSAPEMPGSIASVCNNPGMKFPRVSRSKWEESEGWKELDFSIDEESRCSYEFVSGDNEAKIIARCDLDCDGTVSETTTTLTLVEGNIATTRGEPSPD
jgi:hypothetical protein